MRGEKSISVSCSDRRWSSKEMDSFLYQIWFGAVTHTPNANNMCIVQCMCFICSCHQTSFQTDICILEPTLAEYKLMLPDRKGYTVTSTDRTFISNYASVWNDVRWQLQMKHIHSTIHWPTYSCSESDPLTHFALFFFSFLVRKNNKKK